MLIGWCSREISCVLEFRLIVLGLNFILMEIMWEICGILIFYIFMRMSYNGYMKSFFDIFSIIFFNVFVFD